MSLQAAKFRNYRQGLPLWCSDQEVEAYFGQTKVLFYRLYTFTSPKIVLKLILPEKYEHVKHKKSLPVQSVRNDRRSSKC